jgi:hypothetical protein
MLDYSGFVVSISYQQDVLGVGSEPFHRGVHDSVKISVGVVFGTDEGLVCSTVIFPTHAAVCVAIQYDGGIPLDGFVQMVFQQPSIAMGVVPMQVAHEQELLPRLAGDFVNVSGVLGGW